MAGGNQGAAHMRLKNEILLALGCSDKLLIWNNPTGVFRGLHDSTVTRVGMPGQPDIIAIAAPSGRFIGIEVKTGKGTLSDVQKCWKAQAEFRGALYIVARSVNNVVLELSKHCIIL